MKFYRLALILFALAPAAGAQTQTPPPKDAPPKDDKQAAVATTFTPEQLEQIVAPIALHPDSLLAQILMASTYPLEIVEAYRWVEKNPGLKEKALEDALKKQEWDPSVKSIVGFQSVLKQMNDNLDWTQDLGDAFLGQKKELMDTVQKMRQKALDAGTLKTSEQQKVTQGEDKVIVVETSSPEVIYVPSYSPTVVYGSSWSYPYYYYPPMYYPPPAGSAFFAFSAGVVWGAAVWGNCNWGGGDVDIDVNNFNNFNRNTNINSDRNQINARGNTKQSWNHSPEHRKGVNYKSPQTAQQFGAKSGSSRVSKDQARGYDRGGSKNSPSAGTRPAGGSSGAGARPSTGASTRPSAGTSGSSGSRAGSSGNTSKASGGALSGSRSPSSSRSASSRGSSSRSGGGGGGRSGGGGRGGGGRR